MTNWHNFVLKLSFMLLVDGDDDRTLDGLEYALKGDPNVTEVTNILPDGTFTPTNTTIEFRRDRDAKGLLHDILRASHASGPWTEAAVRHTLSSQWKMTGVFLTEDLVGNVTLTVPISVNTSREFWKLRLRLVDETP